MQVLVMYLGIIGEVSNGERLMIENLSKTKKYLTDETVGSISLIVLRTTLIVKLIHY